MGSGMPATRYLLWQESQQEWQWGSLIPEEASGQKWGAGEGVREKRGKGRAHLFSVGVVDRRDNPANHNKPPGFVQIISGSF